jgi:hypothetical protein
MAIKRIAAACALFGVALAWLLVPMPAAADGLPSVSHGTDSAPPTCSAPTCLRLLTVRTGIGALGTVAFPRFVCPSGYPWLLNKDLSPGRLVPKGIQVIENGGVGVTLYPPATTTGETVIGYADGSATNWTLNRQEVLVYASCTNNRDDSYRNCVCSDALAQDIPSGIRPGMP